MKNLNKREQPDQAVPIIIDQMTRNEWLLELERASDRIEEGLLTVYRGYRSLFIKLNNRFVRFIPSRRRPIERYLKNHVVFPLLKNLNIKGSYHPLKRFANDLLYTAVKNFSIQAQRQETSKRVAKEIQRQDQKGIIKQLLGSRNGKNGSNGYGRAA